MAEILTIGSSLIDIFVHSDEFHLQPSAHGLLLCQQYGEKIELSDFSLHTGGGGSNSAVGFSRLGHQVACVSELGRDAWAEIIAREMQAERVNDTYLIREKKEQTGGSVILVAADGGRTVLVHRGAASQLDPVDVPIAVVKGADWVHISSISGQVDTLRHIFALRRDSGKTAVSWNPGKRELLALAHGSFDIPQLPVQVLMMNAQEWELVAAIQTSLQERVPEIVITNGSAGGSLILRGRKQTFAVQQVASVDDTGAGDAFATGYVAARINDAEPIEALKWAKANSASVVQQVGAKPGLLTKSALEQAVASMA